jgi:hypothetical protein
MLGNRPLDLVGWRGTAVGFAAAGWALLRTNNNDFDLPTEPAQGLTLTRHVALQKS